MGLSIKETQYAIKEIKDYFEKELSKKLNLTRVSAPLFLEADSGLNDDLTGKEKAVSFKMKKDDKELEIIQSLAKWKRLALKRYNFDTYEGLYTDMNAIRPDETLDETHSLYVDQWDWEKVIKKEDRNLKFLIKIVDKIFLAFKNTENYLLSLYPNKFKKKLPKEITYLSTQDLEDLYPDKLPKEREDLIAKKYKAVFIYKIGDKLKSGKIHDFRAPDYDDWKLNGDIIFWDPILKESLELSSMGIRVDEKALKKQLMKTDMLDKMKLYYHKLLLEGELPYTIGGGIGQSRMCMFFLDKKHIGEVQASIWTNEIREECKKKGIFLL